MSWTYSDVDAGPAPERAAAWLDRFAHWPDVVAYKARVHDLVGAARPAIDVGCGLGDDVRALGRNALGVDTSLVMLSEAKRRGGAFMRASAHGLPFATSSAGVVRADRVLQHVPDPVAALDEMARVGRMIVCAEPDQSTLTIEGTDVELTPDIVRFRAEHGIRNATFAGAIAGHLERLGFTGVATESFAITITDPALALGMPTWPPVLVELGWWTEAQAERFSASIDVSQFRYRFDVVITVGRR